MEARFMIATFSELLTMFFHFCAVFKQLSNIFMVSSEIELWKRIKFRSDDNKSSVPCVIPRVNLRRASLKRG